MVLSNQKVKIQQNAITISCDLKALNPLKGVNAEKVEECKKEAYLHNSIENSISYGVYGALLSQLIKLLSLASNTLAPYVTAHPIITAGVLGFVLSNIPSSPSSISQIKIDANGTPIDCSNVDFNTTTMHKIVIQLT